MTHPIIKTDNYLLITSKELVEKNYGYSPKSNEIFYYTKDFYGKGHESWVNIIAHLPLKNSPILEGVSLLPPLLNDEDDIDKLAELNGHPESSQFYDYKEGFIDGFLEAKEKYKFTEEDIRKAIAIGYDWCHQKHIPNNWMIDNFIQSLSQPKLPVGFKCAMETSRVPYGDDGWKTVETGYKIINGVMKGEWIFE